MNSFRTLLALLLVLPLAAFAQVRMENIEFSQLPGDKIEIKMSFDGTPPSPTGYTIEQPARIALDLMDVTSGLSQKVHPLGGSNARTVTVVEAGDRTRVIVAMTDLTGYTTRIEGNSLYVFVGERDQAGLVSDASDSVMGDDRPALSAGDSMEADGARVEEIDFRRGENGEGRVIVRLSDAGPGVDVSTEGGDIRVAFSDVTIPVSLQRRLDVTDFATPVLTVDALPEGDDTVLLVEPTGDYDYLAYQADDVFTLEVKPLTPEELEASLDERFLYRGEKLSLNFQDIEIRAVLQLIADFTDLNLVTSDTVAGRITLRLKNVPWDQALDIIMKTKGLDKRQVGNVLMVAPAAELAARERLELENRQQVSELAPLRTEFIEVRYAKATDVLSLFQSAGGGGGEGGGEGGVAGGGGNFLSARGSVIVDERTNSIIITDTVEKINDFRSLLEKLDVPVRQVMIEARIVEINTNAQQDLGIRWGLAGRGVYDGGDLATQVGPNLASLETIRQSQIDGTSLQEANPLTPDGGLTVDFGGGGTSNFAIGFLAQNVLLDLELNALETEGKSEVISRPRVITADKQPAHIEQGAQVPFEQATSSGATAVTFASATLALDVTPQITPDDRVLLELQVTNDSIGGAASNGQPIINTNRVETNVLVSNGETLVLGGIFQINKSNTSSRTPFFGDLPMVGSLFRRNSQNNQKSEILIFITPRLIRDSVTGR